MSEINIQCDLHLLSSINLIGINNLTNPSIVPTRTGAVSSSVLKCIERYRQKTCRKARRKQCHRVNKTDIIEIFDADPA